MEHQENYFEKLTELMEILRGPEGCPWDRDQTRETLKHNLIEEAYEVLEALDTEDADEICEELGDLLLQIVFHSQISKERGEFDAHEVCKRVYEKIVRRHPHVFGDAHYEDARELLRHWEDLKKAEKEASGRKKRERQSILDGTPANLPTLNTTYSISSKAARVGFDWPKMRDIRDKFLEEFAELEKALAEGNQDQAKEEVGDLIFAAVNISRYLEIDPETALRRANEKFAGRFKKMESHFKAQGRALKNVGLQEMEEFWQQQKGFGNG
ncbi:MAG: nucleoside triphosphate pyrophosphohydrolase [Acidobacteriota bacterium]